MNAHIHVCMPAHAYAHAYARINLHPDMKIIKIKVSDLYEKKNTQIYTCYFTSNERGKFLVIILPKSHLNLRTFIHMYYLHTIIHMHY